MPDCAKCKLTKCATPGSLSGWQLATELANDNSAENANCIFIEPRFTQREYSSFVIYAKVSQAQPSLTNCQLCQTVASTKIPGHSDNCIVLLWKQDGRTGSKICMLLVCQKINVGLSQLCQVFYVRYKAFLSPAGKKAAHTFFLSIDLFINTR